MNPQAPQRCCAHLEGILACSSDAIIAVDADSHIVLFNDAAERLLRCSRAEALGTPLERFIPEHNRASHARSVEGYKNGTVVPRRMGMQREISALRADGSEFPAEASISRVQAEGGALLTVTLRDVTERVCAEARVRELSDSLQARVAERTERLQGTLAELETFCYTLSHDLRAPLRAIDGYTQMVLEDEKGLSAEGREHLGLARESARRMSLLIDGLTAFARLANAKLEHGPVDLGELAREIVGAMGDEGALGHCEVEIGPLPTVDGDRALLRQALAHLLSNAVKFSAKKPVPRVTVGSEAADGGVRVYVRDNGAGFDPAHARKLFGIFQRLHHPGEFEGVGVGLAMARRILELHGETIEAHGRPGEGATFRFTVRPFAEGAERRVA